MPKKTKKAMKIINLDKNGNVIPDMSKIVLPEDISRQLWEMLNPGRKAKKKEDLH